VVVYVFEFGRVVSTGSGGLYRCLGRVLIRCPWKRARERIENPGPPVWSTHKCIGEQRLLPVRPRVIPYEKPGESVSL